MASDYEDSAKIAALPTEGVHCFPANGKKIRIRRIVSIPLMLAFFSLAFFFLFGKTQNIVIACFALCAFIITVLYFAQTFLIEKYRVAIDYDEKKVVLRYRYSFIALPFSSFDAREGVPDKAEALLDSAIHTGTKNDYIILDNVFTDVCFQTSLKDLASKEEFLKLKEEAFAIADAYGARNSDKAIRVANAPSNQSQVKADGTREESIDDIVSRALDNESDTDADAFGDASRSNEDNK